MNDTPKAKRGLAAMSPEKRREIARLGGKAVPSDKRGFSNNPELARRAGAIGGKRERKDAVPTDPKD